MTTDMQGLDGPARHFAGGEDVDRRRLMRKAKRHSALVRVMRIALPALAAGSLLFYGVALRLAMPPTVAGLNPGRIKVSTKDLVMETPRYEGFNKDGGKYFVTSKTATQDFRQKGPVRLETITGTLTQPDKSLTDLKATRGTYDTKTSVLELMDGIEVVSQNGMRADLSRATLNTKDNTIVSREPVKVDMPTAHVTSNQIEIQQKARTVAFIDNVVTTLKPQPKATPAGAPAPAAADRRSMGIATSNEPVVVNSARLDIDDTTKIAVFRGAVHAVQGQATMTTEELEAHYAGQPVAGGVPQPAAKAGGQQDPASKLKKLISRVPVVLTNAGDKATGNAAAFDVETETAVLLGDVVLTSGADRKATSDRADMNQRDDTILLTGTAVHVVHGRNELKGRRMWVDRKTGHMQLTSPGDGRRGASRIFARFYQAEQKPGAPAKKTTAEPAADGIGFLGGSSFKSDPNAPIDIDSDSLDVNDNSKQAIFRGKVNAVQGDIKVQTAVMTAVYTGQAGLAAIPGDPRAKAGSGPKSQAAQLTKIEAREGVIVTSKDGQKATGKWADFDVKSNSIVMGGDVVLERGKNVVRGTKLLIDLTTGESRVLTPEMPAAPAVPVQPDAATGQITYSPTSPGRPRAVFYPDQAKKAHTQAKKEGKSATEAAAAAIAAGTGGAWATTGTPKQEKSEPATSSWDPSSAFPDGGRN